MLPLFAERVGLLVVDEAHCISRLGPRLPARLPAHAGDARAAARGRRRAVHDRDRQRPRGGRRRRAAARSATRARCGPTAGRWAATSLRLEVVELPAPADRLAWLATHLPELPGSGIVYTLTKRDADTVAELLNGHGVPAEAYSGEVDTDDADRRSRSGCSATSSRPSSPRARSAWATTSPTSASSCTTRRPAR